MQLGYFCNAKCQCGIQSTLAFLASHEALRRMAVFPSQLARSHTRPASREARCRAATLGMKAAETRGPLPSVSRAPYLSVCPCAAEPHREGCRALALPRGLSPSGGLGDESAGNARPSAERFQSAMLICTPLRAIGAQKRVQGFSPAAARILFRIGGCRGCSRSRAFSSARRGCPARRSCRRPLPGSRPPCGWWKAGGR